MTKARKDRIIENGGSFSRDKFETMCILFGHRCVCCGEYSKKLHADHIIPVLHGGSSNISNIQPLCKKCNIKKQASESIDYRKSFFTIFNDTTGLKYFVKINFLINMFYMKETHMIREIAEAWGMTKEREIIFRRMTEGI